VCLAQLCTGQFAYQARGLQAGLAMNRIFEVLGGNKKLYRILSYRARGRRAHADHATWPVSLKRHRMALSGPWSGHFGHGAGVPTHGSTNLISFLKSVESHRTVSLPLKFAREVLHVLYQSAQSERQSDPAIYRKRGKFSKILSRWYYAEFNSV
jgi:hypothetical protein